MRRLSWTLQGLLTSVLGATFIIATCYGLRYPPAWTFWGVMVSGLFWLLASLVPIWSKGVLAPAVFNAAAASAAVFAALTALNENDFLGALNLLKL